SAAISRSLTVPPGPVGRPLTWDDMQAAPRTCVAPGTSPGTPKGRRSQLMRSGRPSARREPPGGRAPRRPRREQPPEAGRRGDADLRGGTRERPVDRVEDQPRRDAGRRGAAADRDAAPAVLG